MKYCVKCGQQLPDQAKFCAKCGQPQPVLDQPVPEQTPVPSQSKPEAKKNDGKILPSLSVRIIWGCSAVGFVIFMAILSSFGVTFVPSLIFGFLLVAISLVMNLIGMIRSIKARRPLFEILLSAVFVALTMPLFISLIILIG